MKKNAIVQIKETSSAAVEQLLTELKSNNFNVTQSQPAIGLIFGEVEESNIKAIRQIKNVKSAELDAQVAE